MKCALYPLCAPMINTPRKLSIAFTNWNLPQTNYSKQLLISSCTGTTAALSTGWASIPSSRCSQPGPIFQFSLRFLSSCSITALTPGRKCLQSFLALRKVSFLLSSQNGTPERSADSPHPAEAFLIPAYPIMLKAPTWCSPNALPTRSKDTLEERKAGRTHFLDCKYFISNAIPFCALPSAPMLVPMLVLQQQSFYFFSPFLLYFFQPHNGLPTPAAQAQCWGQWSSADQAELGRMLLHQYMTWFPSSPWSSGACKLEVCSGLKRENQPIELPNR